MTTAFPEGSEYLSELIRDVILDISSLSRPLTPCDLSKCCGTCCHDGVYLSSEEATVIRKLVESEKESLTILGADLPEQVVVYGKFKNIASGPKTATRPAPMKERVKDYPPHFLETNCVFLLPDARCSLQALAIGKKIDPWFFKPSTCWIHPLSFSTNKQNRNVLTLFGKKNDPHCFNDYDGFVSKTHCGRSSDSPDAKPAYEVLEAELERLGELGGRDLMKEIREAV